MIDHNKLKQAVKLTEHYTKRFNHPACFSVSFNEDGSIIYNFSSLKDSFSSGDIDELMDKIKVINDESKSMEFFRLGVK
jgi:hypothetical protein